MNLKNARLGMVIVDLQNDFLAPDGAYARGNTVSAEAQQLPARMAPSCSRIGIPMTAARPHSCSVVACRCKTCGRTPARC